MKSLLLSTFFILLLSHLLIAQSPFGNIIDFDGDGGYASTVNEPVFPTSNGTIESLILARSISGYPSIGDAIFAKNVEQWNDGDFYMWFESTSGNLIATIQSNPSQPPINTDVQSNSSFWNNYENWFHIAFTWGNSGMKLYLNGVLQSDQSSVTYAAMNNICNFYIGTHGYKLYTGNYDVKDFFDGKIDEVRIWNHQRTAEQINSLSGVTLDSLYYTTIDSGLVGYWKFDELENLGINNDGIDDVRDFSVLHNHLDLTGDTHLVPANPSLKIISIVHPNGGESLTIGSTYFIEWISQDVVDVKLEYSTDDGVSWISIIDSIPSSGIYDWTVPGTLTTNGRVKISDISEPGILDFSDGSFIIQSTKVITVINPNGGEILDGGSQYEILWNSEDVEFAKLEYSINNGASWNSIIDSTESTGVYLWIVPNVLTTQARIKISDISLPSIYDASDETFRINYPVNVDENVVVADYKLQQSYPNPFNPSTVIKYQIPELSFVSLKIYDVLGNEVVTLVNEEKSIGNYEIKFNAADLSSGVYYYGIKAGEFADIKKMLLLK
jgi:hypothetical protein